jgi:hypothetical protein
MPHDNGCTVDMPHNNGHKVDMPHESGRTVGMPHNSDRMVDSGRTMMAAQWIRANGSGRLQCIPN